MTRWLAIGIWVLAAVFAPPTQAQSRFDGWAAVIIAADWRSGDGKPIQAFDNALRDLTAAFERAGFDRSLMVSRTLRPDIPARVSAEGALMDAAAATKRGSRGCLFYVTSHGSPEGVVFGPDRALPPAGLATLMRRLCQDRPTVVVVSACYSGVFLEALSGPNRMVLTAARSDRASFGCSEEATYPYFDGCILESLPGAADFIALANAARACVARRELEEGLTPASEPQVRIGTNMQMLLPTLRFSRFVPVG